MNAPLASHICAHYKAKFNKSKFIPNVTPVPVSGKVFDEKEMLQGVEAVLGGWWTEEKIVA